MPDAVIEAAKELGDCRRKWMKLGTKQIELSERLIEVMRENKVKRYVDDDEGYEYLLVNGDPKIKMKRIKDEATGEKAE